MPTGLSYPWFYGLQRRWLVDRLYKLYLAPSAFCGAWIAGDIYEELAPADAALCGPSIRFFVFPLIRHKVRQRRRHEERDDALDPLSPEFLEMDHRNFRLGPEEIQRVVVSSSHVLWATNNSGSVVFHGWDGSRRKFILIGEQSIEPLRDQLGRLVPNVEASR